MPGPTLAQALREQYEGTVIRQAETIRDWPREAERVEQAKVHVRLVLWEQAIGRITQATQSRVYSILSFVMPAEGAFADEMVPMDQLEREADWETAYHEQLQRQICKECGDGLCPVDDDSRPPTA